MFLFASRPFICLSLKVPMRVFCTFLLVVHLLLLFLLNYRNYLYRIYRILFSDTNIFFQSVVRLFIFFMVSFDEQIFLILIKSILSYFPLWLILSFPRNIFLPQDSYKNSNLYNIPDNFIILTSTFRSSIKLDLIFVCDTISQFSLFSHHYKLKRFCFP